jgi:hypothetical protein
MQRHADSPLLARPLARLCERTGQAACALQFAQVWRDNAVNRRDLEDADRFLWRLSESAQ